MHKKLACSLLGAALLLAPIAVSAQTTSTASSLIATLEALVQTLEQELQQLIAAHSGATATTATTATTQQPTTSTTSSTNLCATYASLTQGDTDATTNGEVSQLQSYVGISPTTGYYGAQTSIAYQNKCGNLGNAQPTSVAGMSEYTDSSFGFSFWYPSGWSVKQVSIPSSVSTQFTGGTIHEELFVGGQDGGVDLYEVSSTAGPVTDNGNGGGADFEQNPVTYFFSSSAGAWMSTVAGDTSPADVSNNTMGGLHMLAGISRFDTDIIPLSASAFVITIDGGEYGAQALAKTITATSPAVATPLSTSQQLATIEAEAGAYGVSSSNASAELTASPTSGPTPLAVSFSASQSAGTGEVDFGDGNTSSLLGVAEGSPQTNLYFNHTYLVAGTYTAKLEDSSGNVLATQAIIVTEGTHPFATIDRSSLTASTKGFVTLTGSASGVSQITVSLDGANIGPYTPVAVVGPNGSWSATFPRLTPGAYSVSVSDDDAGGASYGSTLATGTLSVE